MPHQPYQPPAPPQPYPGPYGPPAGPYRQPEYRDYGQQYPDQYAEQQGYQHGYAPQGSDPRYADPRYSDQQYYGRQPGYPEVVASLHADDGSGRSHQLQPGSNIVGRGQDAAFRLPDTSVSRRHLDVYFDGHIAVMHDLGSTNGTTVNGTIVQTWQLADGDVIRLGHSTIIFSQRG